MATNTRTSRHSQLLPTAAVLTLAVPLAVWGLVGQQNAQGLPPSELDYSVRPWDIPAGAENLIAALATLLAVGCGALLTHATRAGTFDRRWWQVLGPLLIAGALAGAGWRVLTAGVIGANIGAGAALLLGAPLVGALVLWSLGRGAWLATHRSGTRALGHA
ncbi:hypothetical protein [Streptomyces iconiensis]|uniref:Uncharacterized protein n=1 Tax=Streptomyces iconiensis TaxID=1384038 RepID=A0ABT6ZXV7_9ACTN|nr:hypothetical protein [Streptomyces iconiensis]MDJ1133243.1 hypothetical protein [Streptomyces iconiensis]